MWKGGWIGGSVVTGINNITKNVHTLMLILQNTGQLYFNFGNSSFDPKHNETFMH